MNMISKDKAKALDLALGAIEKQFGKGAIMRLGSDSKGEVSVFSSGCFSLDLALGVGGLPRGRVVEIFGPESSGKTTMALHAVAEVQKAGGVAAFIDAEHALDTRYAKAIGVKLEEVLISQPDTGEQALEIVDMLVNSGGVDLIVVDSVAALTPRAEIEGNMGDSHVGLQARLMSQALRKLTGNIGRTQCTVIFINQIRMKIGVMFGSPETTTGGNALKFYASVRLDIRRIASIKQGDDVVGNRVRIKVVKNKVAAPFREAEFDVMFGQGYSKVTDVLDLATNKEIILKSGSWFSYKDQRIGQGRDRAKEFLIENPKVFKEIEHELNKIYGLEQAALVKKAAGSATVAVDEADSSESGSKRKKASEPAKS